MENLVQKYPANFTEVNIDYLKPGTVLSGITFDEYGNYVWPAYKPFTEEAIKRIRSRGIKKLYYTKGKGKGDIGNKNPMISEETQREAVEVVDELVKTVKLGRRPDIAAARRVVDRFFQEMSSKETAVINLMIIKNYDDYTYTHSINVGILSMFLAKKMGYSGQIVKEVGLGGFLHDLGKVRVPPEIVNKRGKLTEEEFRIMKKHPQYGFFMIKDDKTVSSHVKRIVLLHHERYDGKGYPLGLKGSDIGRFPQIVSVCDIYDALTTERPYKKAFSVNDSLIYIMRKSGEALDPIVAQRFIYEISRMFNIGSFYPVGTFVILNTGEKAKVVDKKDEYTMSPIVSVIENSRGLPVRIPFEVDLSKDTSRFIVRTIDDPDEIERLTLLSP